jgi:hypothetical protein
MLPFFVHIWETLKIYCSAFLEEIGGKMQHNAF